MFRSFGRVIKFGCQSFVRNFWLSLVTITIVTLSLLSVSALAVVTVVSSEALLRLEQKVDVSIYLKPKLADNDVLELKAELEGKPGVIAVTYISPTEALERFRDKYRSNQRIAEALVLLGVNPLGGSLTVRATDEASYRLVLEMVETEAWRPLVQEAHFEDYRQVLAVLSSLTTKVERVGLAVSLLFLVIALLVVFNTIRLNIYSHREEIEIERLVGSTNWFIRGPFWVESVLYALVATLLAGSLFYMSLGWVEPYVIGLFDDSSFSLVSYFWQRAPIFFGTQFAVVTLLNLLASYVAMRRYLRV